MDLLGRVLRAVAGGRRGLRGSIVAGGVLCAGGCAALALPRLWRYESGALRQAA